MYRALCEDIPSHSARYTLEVGSAVTVYVGDQQTESGAARVVLLFYSHSYILQRLIKG